MNFKVGDRVKINEEWYLKNLFPYKFDMLFCTEYEITKIKDEYRVVINDGERDFFIRVEALIKVEKEKEFNNNDLCGRRFKILYKSFGEILDKVSLLECKPTYIEGIVKNFRPSKQVVLNDDKYGFNIIPFESIVYMEEIIINKN